MEFIEHLWWLWGIGLVVSLAYLTWVQIVKWYNPHTAGFARILFDFIPTWLFGALFYLSVIDKLQ